jgi:hypothetical protein
MQPSPMFLETLKQGIKSLIDVGAFGAKEIRIYDENNSVIKGIYRTFGYCNVIEVLNTSLTITLMISLDGVASRSMTIPGGFTKVMSDVQFKSFTIRNMTSNVSIGEEIYVTVGYEPPTGGTTIAVAGLK